MASWRQVPFCAGCLVPSSVWLLSGGQSPPSCVALSSEEKGALLCRDVRLWEDGLRCSWKLVTRHSYPGSKRDGRVSQNTQDSYTWKVWDQEALWSTEQRRLGFSPQDSY